jgi:uncharacterized protein YcnI
MSSLMSARPSRVRPLAVVFGVAVATLVVTAPVLGHVSIPEGEVASGSTAVIHLRVPHGCDGAATDTLEVQLPDGVVGAQPAYVPGWIVETEMVESEPYERFGETLTERVGIIRWSGGDLPSDAFYDFGIRATFLVDPGTTLAIPAVQACGDAEEAWIEPVVEGEPEPEYPAPTLTVGEAVEAEAHH